MSALGQARQGRRATTKATWPLETTAADRRLGAHRQLAAVGIAALAAAVLVAWLLVRDRGVERPLVSAVGPALLTRAGLERVAEAVGHPVYWAGDRAGYSYELTVTAGGRVFVRYLPQGVSAGDPRADFLTVATYPDARAFANLERAAGRSDAASVRLDDGGLTVVSAKAPSSAYVGWPGSRYQVEVFDPSGDARGLVVGRAVVPVP